MALKPHPAFAALEKAGVTRPEEVAVIVGLVAGADGKAVRLTGDLSRRETVTVAASDVLFEEQRDDTSPAMLVVRTDAEVTVTTTVSALRKPKGDGPSGSDVQACIQQAREQCISDVLDEHPNLPRSEAEKVCDAGILPALREYRCKNPGGIFGGGGVIFV